LASDGEAILTRCIIAEDADGDFVEGFAAEGEGSCGGDEEVRLVFGVGEAVG
jgi:hypothetical protein